MPPAACSSSGRTFSPLNCPVLHPPLPFARSGWGFHLCNWWPLFIFQHPCHGYLLLWDTEWIPTADHQEQNPNEEHVSFAFTMHLMLLRSEDMKGTGDKQVTWMKDRMIMTEWCWQRITVEFYRREIRNPAGRSFPQKLSHCGCKSPLLPKGELLKICDKGLYAVMIKITFTLLHMWLNL